MTITQDNLKDRLNDIFIGCTIQSMKMFDKDGNFYLDIYDLRTETIVISYMRIFIDNKNSKIYITKDYPCVFISKSFKNDGIGDISSFIKDTINRNVFGSYMTNINTILGESGLIVSIMPVEEYKSCKEMILKYEISYMERTIYLHINLDTKKTWFTSDISDKGYMFEIHDFMLLEEYLSKFNDNILKQN